jgi:hypothetical protein
MAIRLAATRSALALCLALFMCSCTHLKYASVQAEYARIQNAEPGQVNVKHMLDRDTFFVHGRCIDDPGRYKDVPKAIAAFSNKFQRNERVDTMYFEVAGSHFGLNLPEGYFDLLVFADIDGDGLFEAEEAVGRRAIGVNNTAVPEKVLGQMDVQLADPLAIGWDVSFSVPDRRGRVDSLFYPSGTIRSLDDPIFDRSFSTLGMYDPASFSESEAAPGSSRPSSGNWIESNTNPGSITTRQVVTSINWPSCSIKYFCRGKSTRRAVCR